MGDQKIRRLNVYRQGMMEYPAALELQKRLLELRKLGQTDDSIIFLEHPHTLTTGRRGNTENILVGRGLLKSMGIRVESVSRGGDITYHGPGQLVCYPIIDLKLVKQDLKHYVFKLEEAIINTLWKLGVAGQRVDGIRGAWVGEKKIASIGIGVSRWVTYHGLALNVNTDLSFFDLIVPCGFTGVSMTSIRRELPPHSKIDMRLVEGMLLESFAAAFNFVDILHMPSESTEKPEQSVQ